MFKTGDLCMISLDAAMRNQSPTPGGWICPECINYKGRIICSKGVLICFAGANMSGCLYFEKGKVCIHCGKAT